MLIANCISTVKKQTLSMFYFVTYSQSTKVTDFQFNLDFFTLVYVYFDLLVFACIASTIHKKHAICLKDYRIRSFLSTWHAHGDLYKHLGIDSSTDLDDLYSNLFLNAYINRHAHTEYLNMIEVYSPLGIGHVFLYSINTNIYHFQSMKYRQYVQIPANRHIHLPVCFCSH